MVIAALLLLAAILIPGCNGALGPGQAEYGDIVKVDYTGKLEDGTVFDTSIGKTPLEFTLGAGKVIPGFEKAVLGMRVGETKTVTIPPDDAYGPSYKELIVEVPRNEIRGGIPEVGMRLQQVAEDGSVIEAVVTKVTDTTVTVDANHSLAGKDLTFDIELLSIE